MNKVKSFTDKKGNDIHIGDTFYAVLKCKTIQTHIAYSEASCRWIEYGDCFINLKDAQDHAAKKP